MSSLNNLDFNEEFVAAFEAIENTGRHIYVTGKAGTGKSTLLQYFRQKTTKKIAVLAPTGVAAINIKGQTIHSFFQFKPDITPQAVGDIPVRKKKRQMFSSLDAIVIDEVSMVRADLIDCIDAMLRLYGPDYDRPFGGIQMIFFGDLFQLPPVVRPDEEHIFSQVYPTPFFFSAKAFESLDYQVYELNKIYRQKDEKFIHLLNALRSNALQAHHMVAFNSRLKGRDAKLEGIYITLTTTNALADRVNTQMLMQIQHPSHMYQGMVSGDFDRKFLPTSDMLELKVEAQVMLLNNDTDKRWVNGSLGRVEAIRRDPEGEDVILVRLDTGAVVDVKRFSWELYQYYFDEANGSLSSKVVGYFTQYPLKLAWAVTIHKSQGQTFDRVIVDVGSGTFAHGQMYVALSRCTSLEGLVLRQPMSPQLVMLDRRVVAYHREKIESKPVAAASEGL